MVIYYVLKESNESSESNEGNRMSKLEELIESFRLVGGIEQFGEIEVEEVKTVPIQNKFLSGGLDISLLQRVACVSPSAGFVFLALIHRCDLQRTRTVKLSNEYLELWGISRMTKCEH
jgi:hypothetical protein